MRYPNGSVLKKIPGASKASQLKTAVFELLLFFHWIDSGHLYYCSCPVSKQIHKITSTWFKAANLVHHQLCCPCLKVLLT